MLDGINYNTKNVSVFVFLCKCVSVIKHNDDDFKKY